MIFLSALVGILTGLAVLCDMAFGTAMLMSQHAETLTVGMLLSYVTVDALCTMAAAAASGLVTLGLLARMVRGSSAIGFSIPSDCTSLAAWVYSRWQFYGRGRQNGLRVFGIEIAIEGQVA